MTEQLSRPATPTAPMPPTIEDNVNLTTGEVFLDRSTGHPVMQLKDVGVAFGGRSAVRNVSFDVFDREITALIGPSGSGKTTLLRALNRMHDTVRSAKVTGKIMLGDTDVYSR